MCSVLFTVITVCSKYHNHRNIAVLLYGNGKFFGTYCSCTCSCKPKFTYVHTERELGLQHYTCDLFDLLKSKAIQQNGAARFLVEKELLSRI